MSHYTIKNGFTSEQMEEIENKVNKLVEGLADLKEYVQEIVIDREEIREIPFLNVLNTAMSAQIEDLKEFVSMDFNCENFESWKKVQEIFNDESVEFLIEFGIDTPSVTVSGTVNLGTGKVECDSEEMMRDDITRISFELNGDIGLVCLDCGEGIIREDDRCSNCG